MSNRQSWARNAQQSKGGGAWRNNWTYKHVTRPNVLRNAHGLCQIKGPNCTKIATQVHHINGVSDQSLNDEAQCIASCKRCNQGEGRPDAKGIDPAPMGRTQWARRD